MRILVAEDHPTLAQSIARGLRDEGYAVDLTTDGEEAMHWAITNQYGCIVLDIMMPGRDGWSVLRALRQRQSPTPVIFLTARDAVDDRVRGLDMGADDYVVKPFSAKELLARVEAVLRRAQPREPDVRTIKFGKGTIDLFRREIRWPSSDRQEPAPK